MNISLSADQEQFVRGLVAGGQYSSEQEVIAVALRLLTLDDELALREDIAIGIAQADRGEMTPFDPEATCGRAETVESAGVIESDPSDASCGGRTVRL